MSSTRLHYESLFKRKVIIYAENNGNRAAGREFKISEANIRRWRNNRDCIFACKATTKCFTGPKGAKFPQIDDAVLRFVMETRAKGLSITREKMQLKAIDVAKSLGIDKNVFKATGGWCDKFMHRNRLSLKCRKKLPVEQKLLNFQEYVIQLKQTRNRELAQTESFNETSKLFDMLRSVEKTQIRSTNHRKHIRERRNVNSSSKSASQELDSDDIDIDVVNVLE